MSGSFKERGLAYIQNGYAIVPIPKGTKGPRHEGWQNDFANSWWKHAELVKGNTTAGIGIIAKFNPAIDIDTLDHQMSDHMIHWVTDNIAGAPVRYGKVPKALMMFQCEEPFTKITSAKYLKPGEDRKSPGHRIEVLGDGQQFVADAIHPDTHRAYEWDGDSPLTVPSIDLPVLTKAQAEAVCKEFEARAEELCWERVADGSVGSAEDNRAIDDPLAEVPPPEETEEEVARVKAALEAMKPNSTDYSYDQWRNVLFALKWTGWECAEELARDWSESSDKHDSKEFRTVWRGAQKRRRGKEFTLATIFHMAKEQGWDASRGGEDKEMVFDSLLEEADALKDDPKPIRASKEILRKLATANLDTMDESEVLRAVRAATNVSLIELRKAIAQYRKQEVQEAATHAGYAKAFIAKLEDKAGGVEPVGCEGLIYTYNPRKGVWEGTVAVEYAVEVANEFDGRDNCERASDYTAIAKHAYSITARDSEDFFNEAPIGLACTGRFYTLNAEGSIERQPISHEHRQRVLSPVRPEVGDMSLFEKFLDETFAGECQQEQIDLLQEIMGGTLIGTLCRYEKAVLFKGPGRAGKGTLMKIIEAMIPAESRTAVSPFRWDGEYYLANLAGKRLNVVGELPDDEAIPAAEFKTVTGRDTLQGRHPTHRPFNFRNQAAHIFNTNHFIHTKDHSEAFYTRWVLFEFRNSKINTDDIESDLAQRIIDRELSHVMAWALKGAKRLQDRGALPPKNAVQHRMMAQWTRRTSSLLEFILDTDYCILGSQKTHATPRADFYKRYSDWCKESNRRPMGKIKVYDEMKTATIQQTGVTFGTDATGRDVIRGLVLRTSNWDDGVFDDDEL